MHNRLLILIFPNVSVVIIIVIIIIIIIIISVITAEMKIRMFIVFQGFMEDC